MRPKPPTMIRLSGCQPSFWKPPRLSNAFQQTDNPMTMSTRCEDTPRSNSTPRMSVVEWPSENSVT